jgi:signal peptidase II
VDTASEPVTRTHGRLALVLGVAAAVVLADLVTKIIVVARLENHEPIELLGGFLTLDVTRNSGAAFSIGTGYTFVFPIIAIVVMVVVVRQARKLTSTAWAITLGALLGGALGNVVCRVFREPGVLRGHVVDWIELPHYPVFNLADSAITLAGISIVVLTVMGIGFDGKRHSSKTDDDTPANDDKHQDEDIDG